MKYKFVIVIVIVIGPDPKTKHQFGFANICLSPCMYPVHTCPNNTYQTVSLLLLLFVVDVTICYWFWRVFLPYLLFLIIVFRFSYILKGFWLYDNDHTSITLNWNRKIRIVLIHFQFTDLLIYPLLYKHQAYKRRESEIC